VDLKISGKIALITGAGRGIGLEVAKSLSREGVTVLGVSRNSKSVNGEPDSNFPGTLITADLCDDEVRIKTFRKILDEFGRIDIIVNNLGGTLEINNPLASYEELEKVMKFNLGVALETNNTFIPGMVERKWGRICHISSISALENHGPPTYCASKAALNAYVRSVGRFLAQENIVLTGVMPGAVLTLGGYWDEMKINNPSKLESYLQNRMSSNRLGAVEEIGGLVCFLVSEHSSFMFGSNILVDGGQGRLFLQY
jgi:3-oxoacyl-[acyl-carrier protein] reductase